MPRQLEPVVPGTLWTAQRPLRFYGLHLTTRMTVARRAGGGLWIHSPIDLDVEGRRELDALGPVETIVAPSRMHHLFLEVFRKSYPAAAVFGTGLLLDAHPGVPFTRALADHAEPEWADELDQARVAGHRFLDEVVFLHRPTRTLILCDLLESVHADSPWLERVVGHVAGIFDHPRPPPDMRLGFRDHAAARAFLDRVLSWDFDRIILAHGHLIESGGRDVLRSAFAFLFD